jgi:hypothetical protein
MAEDLTPVTHDEADSAEEAFEPAPYQSRFQLVFGVLLGIGLAAVAAAVLFTASDSGRPQQEPTIAWSSWKPASDDALTAIREIADHIGQSYTLPSGNQLVAVRGGGLTAGGLPATVTLDRSVTADGSSPTLEDGAGVMYTLCGLGKNCSIKEGKPSIARHIVLRREALELSLYTFRYIKDVGQVVVMMPPPPGEKASQLMFFRRADVNSSLVRPLTATLPGRAPAINRLKNKERGFLDRLTGRNLFGFRIEPGPDATVFLILTPPPTG